MAQNPWDNDPIVRPRGEASADGKRYRTVRSEYTNETPTQLLNQGYTQEPDGNWVRTVGTEPLPSDAPWANDPVLTESQERAAEIAQQRVQGSDALRSGGSSFYQGVSLGSADELGGYAAGLGQLLENSFNRATGQPIEVNSVDLRNAMTEAMRGEQQRFSSEQPIADLALQAGGGLVTGGVAGVGRGALARAVTSGAGYGGAYGFNAGEGSFADRLPGAAVGAVAGGLTGGAVQGALNVGGRYAGRLAGIAGPIRTVSRAFGNRPAPEVVAAERMAGQIARSGRTPADITSEIGAYRSAGLEPSIIDIGGENLRATVRAAAAGEGPGRQLATDYLEGVQASVGPRSIERARRLTPDDDRDALQVARDLADARRTEARSLYGEAYNQRIEVPATVVRALRGPEGAAAIQEARRIAALEYDDAAVTALDEIAIADLDALPVATGKALEYVRRAYADMASGAEGSLGAALQGRVRDIDTGLDAIPELAEARSAYRLASQQIDAAGGVPDDLGRQRLGRPDRAPQNVLTTDATRYGAYVEGLPPEARGVNQIYQRDRLIESLGRAREGAVGPLNTIRAGSSLPAGPNAPIVARNLEATFPGQGQQFQQDINLAREQVSNAAFVAPNTGSPTASRLADGAVEGAQAIANVATGGKAALVRVAIDNAVRRIGLNEAERQAIVELGIGSADEFERIFRLAEQARSAGRRPPREVRAWVTSTRNTLGANSPVAQQLEQLLLPSRVAAEEQER